MISEPSPCVPDPWRYHVMKKKKNNGISIKVATAVYLVVAILVLTIVIAGVGYNFYKTSVMDSYTKYVTTVLDYAHSVAEEIHSGI